MAGEKLHNYWEGSAPVAPPCCRTARCRTAAAQRRSAMAAKSAQHAHGRSLAHEGDDAMRLMNAQLMQNS